MLTAFFGILILYIYAIVAFHFMDDMYFDWNIVDGERTCSTVLQCFMTTFNYVLRSRLRLIFARACGMEAGSEIR